MTTETFVIVHYLRSLVDPDRLADPSVPMADLAKS